MVVVLYVEDVERIDDKWKFPPEIIGQLFDYAEIIINTTV